MIGTLIDFDYTGIWDIILSHCISYLGFEVFLKRFGDFESFFGTYTWINV